MNAPAWRARWIYRVLGALTVVVALVAVHGDLWCAITGGMAGVGWALYPHAQQFNYRLGWTEGRAEARCQR